jgi:hypothetical protein
MYSIRVYGLLGKRRAGWYVVFEMLFCLPHGFQPRRTSALHRQPQQCAVPGSLNMRPKSSNSRKELGADTGILCSKNQWEAIALEETKSRTGQRALAETTTTRDFNEGSFHLGSTLFF